MNSSNFNRTVKRILIAIAVFTMAGAMGPRAIAQHEGHSGGHAELARLDPGFGRVNHPVSTKNAEAQKFFNQGLALIYGFNHEEARRAFERAAALDPGMVMAYWGVALAVGPNYNEATIDPARLSAANAALDKAEAAAAGASAKERGYIAALRLRFQPNVDPKKCAVAYKDAMGVLARQYPSDSDALTLYADALMNLTPWQLWTKEGQPTNYTLEIVAMLESVLEHDPQHIGANHLYIHAVEASRDPGRALASANRLGKLAPSAGHLVHMPSHVYIRIGDNAAAAKANEDAAEVDRRYIKQTGVTGMYPAMYYSHNLHFALEAYNRMGRYEAARGMAKTLEDNVRGHIKEMPMLEAFFPSVMFVHLRFNRWDEIFSLPAPSVEAPVTSVLWHFARGTAFAAKGKIAEAEAERSLFATTAKNTPGETPFGLNSAAGVFTIAGSVLDARIAQAKGDKRTAIEHWRKAVAAQDALNYDEPPGWYYSTRESLGAALLLAGDAAEAEKVFRKDLEYNPRNGRSLFGLLECLKRQGKGAQSPPIQKEFEAAWANADVKLKIEDL